ncbi:hypothetical protein J7I94_12775 [Streptomyces sp. ISL-12]|uniref:hypothetical protein n=1 Tax=Streptomyces sp. ISL-12 TaxID=2819177 RepID=UPI001BEA2B7B|nr:hypothetical protein [Streptomyces sp. ISL-12]MBT2411434.1 hypothetical protein [Streptomyces sp. ISL-12]
MTAPLPVGSYDGDIAPTAAGGADLDPLLPPRAAYAGAWHVVPATASRDRLARLATTCRV